MRETKGVRVDIALRLPFDALAEMTPEQVTAVLNGVGKVAAALRTPEGRDTQEESP